MTTPHDDRGLVSAWWGRRDASKTTPSDAAALPSSADIVIVGAGLTGLSTAVRLAREGRNAVVLEAKRAGMGTSGRSSAKVSLLHGSVLQRIQGSAGDEAAAAYVRANRAGQDWLLDLVSTRGADVQRRRALTFAVTTAGARRVSAELEASRAAGLEAYETDQHDLPFGVQAVIALEEQAQADPLSLVEALRAELLELGGILVEGTRVTGMSWSRPWRLETDRGPMRCDTVVLATQTPTLDRTFDFAHLRAERSYILAYPVDLDTVPSSMSLSLDEPGRSLRTAPAGGPGEQDLLLVGGNNHETGHGGSTRDRLAELDRWAREHLAVGEPLWSWSAQDYRAAGQLPHVGPVPGTDDKLLVATGFDKWGMTNSAAAAAILTGDIIGSPPEYAEDLRAHRSWLRAGAGAASKNVQVAARLSSDRARLLAPDTGPDRPAEGEGRVSGSAVSPTATSTVDGRTCRVSAVCTHLGGVVTWNDAERTWDCPLHGSRFTATGEVIEGPATHPLGERTEAD